MQWSGTAVINGKYIEPAWSAPASIRRDYQSLPSVGFPSVGQVASKDEAHRIAANMAKLPELFADA
jgi:hypothetical protein